MKQELKGFSYITLSAVFFGSYGIWSRLMADSFGNYSQAWIRGLILLAILIPFGLYKKQLKKIARKDIVWFTVIALCAGLNQAPYYYAFHHLTIGSATLFFYASLTIAGYMVGMIFFGEKLTVTKIISLLLAILGIAITSGLLVSTTSVPGTLCAIIAGAMGGVEVSLSKKISGNYSPIQILIVIFVVMLLGNAMLALFTHDYVHFHTIGVVAEIGYSLSMLIANYTVFVGFTYVDASIGSLIGLSEILFAICFAFIFFRQVLDLTVFIGGGTIILAIALPLLRDMLYEKKLHKW